MASHGRHCPCSACAREDWTNPDLAPCGMHGASCPAAYDPHPAAHEWTAAKHREDAKLVQSAMQKLAERRLTGRGLPFVPIEDASDLLMAMHRDGIYRPAEPPAGGLRDEATLPPDGGERVECAVCHRWPLASNWPNHMQSQGDHWPIWPPATAPPAKAEVYDMWWRCRCHDALLSECPNRDKIAAATVRSTTPPEPEDGGT